MEPESLDKTGGNFSNDLPSINLEQEGYMESGAHDIQLKPADSSTERIAKLHERIDEGATVSRRKPLFEKRIGRLFSTPSKQVEKVANTHLVPTSGQFLQLVDKRNPKNLASDSSLVDIGLEQLNPEIPTDKVILELYKNEGPTLLVFRLIMAKGATENLAKLFSAQTMDPSVIMLIEKGKIPLAVKKLETTTITSQYMGSLNASNPLDRKLLDLNRQEGNSPLFLHLCAAKQNAETSSIDKNIIELYEKNGPTPLVQNLLLAKARGNLPLLEAVFNKNDPQLFKFIEDGQFHLAAEKLKSPENPVWTQPIQSSYVLEKLHTLDADLEGVQDKEKLMSLAVNYSTVHDEENTLKVLGAIQFLLARDMNVEDILTAVKDERLEQVSNEMVYDCVMASGKFRHDQTAAITTRLADLMLSKSGSLNREIVDKLANVINDMGIDSPDKETILQKLSSIKNHVTFSDRLMSCTLPKEGSNQANLVRAMFQVNPDYVLTQKDVRSALISALLWPMRQHGTLGSCFATSVVIQQGSHAEGLKQLMEDYLCLLQDGSLTRNEPPPAKGSFDTPMIIPNFEGFCQKFKNDNLLARAHEFTCTNIGGSKLAGSLMSPTAAVKFIATKVADTLSDPSQKEALLDQITASCCTIFSSEENKWMAVSIKNGMPLHRMTEEEAAQFFSQLSDDDALVQFCKTEKFTDLWNDHKGRLKTNAGSGADNIGTLLCTEVKEVKTEIHVKNGFKDVFSLVERWTEAEKTYARQNPGLLIPFATPVHSFSLRAHELITLYDSVQGDDTKLVETLKNSADTYMQTEVTDTLLTDFLDYYTSFYIRKNTMTHEQVEQYKADIHNKIFASEHPTLETLYHVMKEADFIPFWKEKYHEDVWIHRFEQLLKAQPSLHNLAPPVYYLFDSNWETNQQRGFSMSPFQKEIVPFILGNNAFDPRDWIIYRGSNKAWHTQYKFQDPVRDPLSRTHFKSQ